MFLILDWSLTQRSNLSTREEVKNHWKSAEAHIKSPGAGALASLLLIYFGMIGMIPQRAANIQSARLAHQTQMLISALTAPPWRKPRQGVELRQGVERRWMSKRRQSARAVSAS